METKKMKDQEKAQIDINIRRLQEAKWLLSDEKTSDESCKFADPDKNRSKARDLIDAASADLANLRWLLTTRVR